MKITLGSNGMTKIIECSPYYVAINNSSRPVSFCEQTTDGQSVDVPAGEVSGQCYSGYLHWFVLMLTGLLYGEV